MNISKTTIFIGFSTGIKLLSGLAISKYISVSFGPTGLVVIGQLQNFTSILNTIASGGIQQGITTMVAKQESNKNEISKIIGTAFFISSLFCLITGVVCFLFANYISKYIFQNSDYTYIIYLSVASIVFFTFNMSCYAIINGFKDVKRYTLLNIYSSLIALVITCSLIYFFKLEGALWAIIFQPFFVSFIMFMHLKSEFWLKSVLQNFKFNRAIAKKLLPFSAMSLIGIISLPISLIVIRNFLISKEGIEFAGYWEAVWKISTYYMMILTTGFGVYLLPTYSAISDKKLLRKEVLKSFQFVLLVSSILAICMYFLKKYIVLILFDDSFLGVLDYMNYQLIGDVIKVSSWTIALLLQAKAKAMLFIMSQLIFTSSFVIILMLLYPYFAKQSVFIAYMINYILYIVFIIFICRKILW